MGSLRLASLNPYRGRQDRHEPGRSCLGFSGLFSYLPFPTVLQLPFSNGDVAVPIVPKLVQVPSFCAVTYRPHFEEGVTCVQGIRSAAVPVIRPL